MSSSCGFTTSNTILRQWVVYFLSYCVHRQTDTRAASHTLHQFLVSRINARLKTHTENNKIKGKDQLGFRNNYFTIDDAFVLDTLTTLMGKRNKSIYTVFVDLKKAFRSISMPLLFQKLPSFHIGPRVYSVMRSMYHNVIYRNTARKPIY